MDVDEDEEVEEEEEGDDVERLLEMTTQAS